MPVRAQRNEWGLVAHDGGNCRENFVLEFRSYVGNRKRKIPTMPPVVSQEIDCVEKEKRNGLESEPIALIESE